MGNAPTALNLLFHIVARDEDDPLLRLPGAVTLARLRRLIHGLLDDGLRAASLSDYLVDPPGADRFTVSFDDAHPSILLAAPLLSELGVPATVFVPGAYPGRTDDVCRWDQLRELADEWTIGSHAQVHERWSWRLYGEDEKAQTRRLEASVRDSMETLGARLGVDVAMLAYPFGDAPGPAREAARRGGIRAAFTVAETPDWDGDLLGIPRVDGASKSAAAEPVGISVVVPACDRPEVLREVVRRLAAQTYPEGRWEVLVIDDGSSVDLAKELAPWPSVSVHRLPESGRTFRAGQARQEGARLAKHPVIAFLDADVAVDEDFLWHVGWVHDRDPDAVLLGYLSGYNLHDHGWTHEPGDIAAAGRLTGAQVPVIPDRSREPELARCLDNIQSLSEPWTLAYTGNLSVGRATLARAGGADADFEGWGFEDVDLGLRLNEVGARWYFSRFALGYHLADTQAAVPSNPFRRERPRPADFEGVLTNLRRIEERHGAAAGFVASVRDDITEICSRPQTVGVEMGAPEPESWPFPSLLQPGGVELHRILDRVAYAERIGATQLYLLGGDVAAHPDLGRVLGRSDAAWITIEARPSTLLGGPLGEWREAGLRAVALLVADEDGAAVPEVRGLLDAAGIHLSEVRHPVV
jgi:glycosyltransferase involved in cell wall biosynthesis